MTAEARFLDRLTALRATPASGATWRGANKPFDLICARGHRCNPRPNDVVSGGGVCQQCDVTFDRLYLLAHNGAHAIKVGVASGAGRVREHLRRGYRLVAEWSGLDHQSAIAAERDTIAMWRANDWDQVETAPKDGRTETADSSALLATYPFLVERLGEPTDLDADAVRQRAGVPPLPLAA